MSIPPDYIRRFPLATKWSDYTKSRDFLPPLLGGPARPDKHKQPLHYVIHRGDIPGLRELLSSSELPPDAAQSPRPSSPDVQIDDEPQDQDSTTPRPMAHGTPLQYAASLGDLAAVDALLDAGVHPRWAVEDHDLAPRPWFRSLIVEPIELAIIYGHRMVVARLWERSSMPHILPPEPNQFEQEDHSCPPRDRVLDCLHVAVHSGQAAIVQDLFSWVSDWGLPSSHFFDREEDHALERAQCVATQKWDPHVTAVLLQQDGKHCNFDRKFLSNCLARTCLRKEDGQMAIAKPIPYSALDHVNQSSVLSLLVKAGADPNTKMFGQPMLDYAAASADWIGAMKALLENGANPNEKDSEYGFTALHTVVGTVPYCPGDPEVETVRFIWNETAVRLLLDHGASATEGSFQGTTPLHAAARISNTHLFNLVIQSTAPPGQSVHPSTWKLTNHHGETLLHHACLGGRVDLVELLLDQGLDINQRSILGWTPFLCALAPDTRDWSERGGDWTCKNGRAVLDIVQLLTARGADTSAISESGWTALHVLSLWGCGGHEQGILYPLALRLLQDTPSLVDAPEPLPMPQDWNETGTDDYFYWTEPRRNISLLQWAIEKRSRDVFNALRDMGVDTTAKNADGKTAFEAAREYADMQHGSRSPLSE